MTTKKPSHELTKKFIEGLEKHNLTYDEIINSGWEYCGGDTGRHLNYFIIYFNNFKNVPEKVKYCVCGHRIKENCYITDKERILILGNCCIRKFIPKSSRTC